MDECIEIKIVNPYYDCTFQRNLLPNEKVWITEDKFFKTIKVEKEKQVELFKIKRIKKRRA